MFCVIVRWVLNISKGVRFLNYYFVIFDTIYQTKYILITFYNIKNKGVIRGTNLY